MTNISATEGGQHASAHREVKPHRWALSLWARAFRRLARRWTVHSHVRKYCRPFTVEGRENLDSVQNPFLIIANHTSHFDTVIVLSLLPTRIYDRTAVVAAADRMYRERIKGMWHSLRYNAFPITRGGGREALAYSQWLLHAGWSLLIFPEGKRSRTGELLPFHGGPAILATLQNVPFLPIYIEGASRILPPGTNRSQAAPVTARVGGLLTFPEGTGIGEAKHAMEEAVRGLAGIQPAEHEQAAAS
jgi:1-acyl-sn-glycerol-3-phosphate acyltransferase